MEWLQAVIDEIENEPEEDGEIEDAKDYCHEQMHDLIHETVHHLAIVKHDSHLQVLVKLIKENFPHCSEMHERVSDVLTRHGYYDHAASLSH